ncbi:DUF1294 domain-containing protein [Novilysobacter defluvii]|uniref:DUF1294 domain-containing protein n=1 Tax=Novilysobacter defluvii TaxID=391738 RepID=UPI002694ECDE
MSAASGTLRVPPGTGRSRQIPMGTPIRLAGRITDWNDEKGFGFVVPNGGGDRAFVHIKDFERGSRRPMTGDLISYLPARDAKGRLGVRGARHSGPGRPARAKTSRAPGGALAWIALLVVALLVVFADVPPMLAWGYAVLSVVAFLMYWADKSAAQRNARRTPENTLHLVALLGGWPGALLAQHRFRHKTVKQPFQSVFWMTVVVNVAAASWLVLSGRAAELFGA